ncbi:MAG: matrixin family metalloprotease [Nitrospiraceae bacterium]
MTPPADRVRTMAASVSLCLVFSGCETTTPTMSKAQGSKMHAATDRVKADPETVEKAFARMKTTSAQKRDYWKDKTFEEFERSVYHEPWPGGKYIVDGDTPIADRKHLQEFFDVRVKTQTGRLGPVVQLVVNQEAGQDTVWNSTQKKQLTYCVSSSFGNRHAKMVSEMVAAGGAWEQIADVKYVHVASQDGTCDASNPNVVFDVRPVNVSGDYLARAFFPNEARASRNVLVDESSFQLDPNGKLTLVGILRHELGHTLGFRHEHTRPESGACFEDSDWRPLTDYDKFSVMHYPQCNGGGDWTLVLTDMDKRGAACLYGALPGSGISCPGAGPEPGPCAAQTQTFINQQVAKDEQKAYPAFAVTPGTQFEVKMTGAGTASGDPDLYVQFGQAPTRSSGGHACRPYLTGAEETCALDVPAGKTQAFVMTHGFSAASYNLSVTHTAHGQ